MPERDHAALLIEAIAAEATAQRAALEGDGAVATEGFARAATLYRRSWDAAPPRAFGRLVGMLKAAVLAGTGQTEAAAHALAELGGHADSPASWYATAITALILDDDALAARAANGMREGSEAFARAADAVAALASRDAAAYADAVRAVVADFEGRSEHLTGVRFADTALMLERLAERRGMAAGVRSALLP